MPINLSGVERFITTKILDDEVSIRPASSDANVSKTLDRVTGKLVDHAPVAPLWFGPGAVFPRNEATNMIPGIDSMTDPSPELGTHILLLAVTTVTPQEGHILTVDKSLRDQRLVGCTFELAKDLSVSTFSVCRIVPMVRQT